MMDRLRNATDESAGVLRGLRYLIHDRDTKFGALFLDVLRSSGVRPLALPPRSPNLNAFAERWVRCVRQECLSKLILFGEASLRRTSTARDGPIGNLSKCRSISVDGPTASSPS
jgi:putative transposase